MTRKPLKWGVMFHSLLNFFVTSFLPHACICLPFYHAWPLAKRISFILIFWRELFCFVLSLPPTRYTQSSSFCIREIFYVRLSIPSEFGSLLETDTTCTPHFIPSLILSNWSRQFPFHFWYCFVIPCWCFACSKLYSNNRCLQKIELLSFSIAICCISPRLHRAAPQWLA